MNEEHSERITESCDWCGGLLDDSECQVPREVFSCAYCTLRFCSEVCLEAHQEEEEA